MLKPCIGRAAAMLLLLCGAAAPVLAEEAPAQVDLLRLPAAHLELSTAGLDESAALAQLNDDNPASVATLKARPNLPLDVIYGFGGAEVTAERLVVQLPEGSSTARVEILVSTLSDQAGFRSVRADPLAGRSAAQEFHFQPAGARWIMLRFTPAAGRDRVDIAEVHVYGHEGAPATAYAFKQSPAAAFDVLARLKDLSAEQTALSEDERSLFADAADGKLDQWTLEDAALIASGLRTAQERAPYLARLAAIESAADAAVGRGGTPFQSGARLLKWLYASGALKKYQLTQTDLSGVLDSGIYNCVSSAVLYAVVARHLGLDVRAVEVPDHAFAVVYNDTVHADVETTIADGFNPDRDAGSVSFFRRLTGFSRPPEEKRELRREVGAIGLIASIYYNHGVGHARGRQYALSLGDSFRALSLDPDNASAVQNTLAALANWSVVLFEGGHYQEAVQELEVGLALAPDDAALNNNYLAAWQHWANAEIKAGHRDAALAVLRRAAQAVPKGDFEAMQTWVYISPAQDLAKSGQWQEALAVLDAARPQFQGRQLADLENVEAGVYNEQALKLIGNKRWSEAQALYAGAAAKLPAVELLRQNELYVWSSWCIDDEERGDLPAMLEVALKAHQRFPNEAGAAANEKIAWLKLAESQSDHDDYAAALATTAKAGERFPADPQVGELDLALWVNWSKTLIDAGQLRQATEVADRGLKLHAADEHLRNNAIAAWGHWSKSYADRGEWQAATDTAVQARLRFPTEQRLEQHERYCRVNWIKALADRQDWNGAMAAVSEGLKRFPDDHDLLYDRDVVQSHLGRAQGG